MLKLLILLPITFYSLSSLAISVGTGSSLGMLRISPVIGYEQVQKNYPTPHTSNRLFYGLGVEVGPRAFSIEMQATQGKDSESYSGIEIDETTTKLSLGLKSSMSASSFLNFYFRTGAQGKTSERVTTEAGVSTTEKSAFYVDPYVGTGVNIAVANALTMSVGLTAVFTDYPNEGKIEYQTNLGFGLRF